MSITIEKRKRIVYCPHCEASMVNLYELIDHVKFESCGMTIERLYAVGLLDDGDLEQTKSEVDLAQPKTGNG